MIGYEQAIETLEKAEALPVKTLSVEQAFGRVCAQDVISSVQIPPFRNSAMDGFAIVANQAPSVPVIMDVVGRTAAGDSPASGSGRGA